MEYSEQEAVTPKLIHLTKINKLTVQCPHCLQNIETRDHLFVSANTTNNIFQINCNGCGKPLGVNINILR
jgi:hypothetical protein